MAPRWTILSALTLARTSMGFQFQSVAATAPLLAADLGLDKAQLGWLIGLYLLPGIALALPGGLLGGRFGDKRVVLVGLALMALGGLGIALAATWIEAQAARAVSGIGAVMLNVLLTKMVADWFDGRERVLAMSVLVNAWPIGIGLALLALGAAGERWGVAWALGATAVFAAVGWLAVQFVYRAPAHVEALPAGATGLRAIQRAEWPLLVLASLPWVLFNAAYQIAVAFLPSFFVDQGRSVAQSGVFTALTTILSIASVQAGGVLLKRSRRPDWICHAAMAAWAVTLLALAAGTAPLAWIVLGGLLAGLPASGYVSLPAEFLRAQSRGAGMGVFYTIYYLGCAVFPTAAGALYDRTGSGAAALVMAAALAVASAVALAAFRARLDRSRARLAIE